MELFVHVYLVRCSRIDLHRKRRHPYHLLNYCLKGDQDLNLICYVQVSQREWKSSSGLRKSSTIIIPKREFAIGTKVWVRNMQRGNKWLPGTIIILSKEGLVTYDVEMNDGRVRKINVILIN